MTIVSLSDYRLQKCCRIFHKYITNSDNPFIHDGAKHSYLDYSKMRTHHHNDFTSRYHQRKHHQTPQKHVLQPTTKSCTLTRHQIMYSLSPASALSQHRAKTISINFKSVDAPLAYFLPQEGVTKSLRGVANISRTSLNCFSHSSRPDVSDA